MTNTAALDRAAPPGPAGNPRRPRRVRPSATQLTGLAFIAPLVAFLVIFLLVPIGRGIALSTQQWTIRSFITGEAPFIGLQNYRDVIASPVFAQIAWQTVVFVVVSLLFQYVLGLALAVFFTRRFPLSTTLRSLILLPWLLPLVVSATTWRWMFNQDYGIINSLLGGGDIGWLSNPSLSLWAVIITNIWLGIPFNMVLLYGGIQGISEGLYEAAALDGAGRWRQFWSITMPLLRPVSAVTLLLGLVYTIKVFDVIWVMTRGGPVNSSHILSTWAYQISFEADRDLGTGSAVAQLLVLVSLVFGLLYIRAQRKEAQS
ncbi:MAG TPA: sugar ABC transporter permease [Actinomycetales bacterium]|jgi:multiple sugar transport system permease protein